MVNAANSRFVRLSLGGRPFVVIGTDGGLLAEPIPAAEVLVTPGERVDLAIGPFSEGERLRIEALPYDRGKGETKTETYATLEVGPAAASHAHIPSTLRKIEPLVAADTTPTRTIDLKALMHAVASTPGFACDVFATGMHVLKRYGLTVNEIHKAGIPN